MIDLWYLDTVNVSQIDMESMLKSLPNNMHKEIMRFQNHQDRRLKLYSKLMVKKYFEVSNRTFSWSNWQISPGGKPFYSGGKKFNISHSGSFVTVAFSDKEIGIDIEKCSDFDISTVLDYLHVQEKEFILDANDSSDAFFTVWTRKEAYLKAKGIGIVEGLHHENCLEPSIGFENKWFTTSLSIAANYKLALCSQIPNIQINKLELDPTLFYNE
ncbi:MULTISPECIES: 4'-phosphopantetheinyl transferase superfamily protein [Flavobacterium]|uniref:4'-phosphopantetheinyl transferase superfamily protein n=1 Tax=Flavobacterium lipolyticum TaxID=2893754 RepID=A0ABS8M3X3_9FLAO|nr:MULTISPECIES: 4'-phosphopantetheinyl transferase superfamily protein [unclassified Flavobacterium]MCC9019513.1 4'-phosphopantetheinyl transferase superfamily protein [Flavobacterium sp. F-126]